MTEKPWERTQQECKYCGVVKPINEFYDNLNWTSGKTTQCKACLRSYNIAYQRGRRSALKKRKDES